jgi:hypothetical protein
MTAVEWLVEQFKGKSIDVELDWNIKLIEQAKEMEKKQSERMYSELDLDAFRKFMIQEQNFSKSCLDVFVKQFKNK